MESTVPCFHASPTPVTAAVPAGPERPPMSTTKYALQTGWLASLLAVCMLAGCATKTQQALYDNEEFISGNTYSHTFPADGVASCEAGRRALLSQGFIITESKPTIVKGSKNFQRNSQTHAEIEFTIVCAAESAGSNATTVFVNAVRATYSLKKSSTSASVGVGVLGSLSVPFGMSDDSLVKVASETIQSEKFYAQFFARMETYIEPPKAQE